MRILGITASAMSGNLKPIVTGGVLSSDSTYYYRAFTSVGNNTLTISNSPLNVDYLIVAGGGAGGNGYSTNTATGAGGGAGGLLLGNITIPSGTFNAYVGSGGVASTSTGARGSSGLNSYISGTGISIIQAVGGGAGGGGNTIGGLNGGSGGGSGGPSSYGYQNGGTGTSSQGNNGGRGWNNGMGNRFGAQGGGAGSAGGDGGQSPAYVGNGLGGYSFPNSTITTFGTVTSTGAKDYSSTYYGAFAGGGLQGNFTPGSATTDGGGNGAIDGSSVATNGDPTSGGGGGGGANSTSSTYFKGGNGGSGVVIIRYLKSDVQ